VIAGNDPSGGAGLAADIQAITALAAHPAPVVTAITVQDTRNVYRVQPVAAGLVAEQARTVLADLPVRAIKIGVRTRSARRALRRKIRSARGIFRARSTGLNALRLFLPRPRFQ